MCGHTITVNAPVNDVVAQLTEMRLAVGVARSIGRADVGREEAQGAGKGRLGEEDLVGALVTRDDGEVLMRPRVVSDLMSITVGAVDDLPALVSLDRDDVVGRDEEGSLGSLTAQKIQQAAGESAWAVIEGDGDNARLRAPLDDLAVGNTSNLGTGYVLGRCVCSPR